MSRNVDWTRPALKELAHAGRSDRERIISAVDKFAETDTGDVRRLVDSHPPRYRLRVGTWRIIFTTDHPQHQPGVMVVLRVLPRDKAYR
jgi:mRNA-degrading endonuclease RelE of RelBE toxin-antitoxin system